MRVMTIRSKPFRNSIKHNLPPKSPAQRGLSTKLLGCFLSVMAVSSFFPNVSRSGKSMHMKAEYEYNTEPTLVPELKNKRIIKVSCGGMHTVAMSETGLVYAWGEGHAGQLGVSENNESFRTPQKIPFSVLNPCTDICCGYYHTGCITKKGDVITFGWNHYYQCGHSPGQEFAQPGYITTLKDRNISKLVFGGMHSAAISNIGELYTWGDCWYAQLGIGKASKKPRLEPKIVQSLRDYRVKDLSCGDFHSMAICDNRVPLGPSSKGKSGSCYRSFLFGWGRNGVVDRLGIGADTDLAVAPTRIPFFYKSGLDAVQVSCGDFLSAVLTKQGQVYIVGSTGAEAWEASERRLSEHEHILQHQPRIELVSFPNKERIVRVECGGSHVLALSEDGRVYSWGSGTYGKLGHGSEKSIKQPTVIQGQLQGKRVVQISCGLWHSACLTDTAEVYVWGKLFG